jgi:hypothetical protein
MILIHENKLIYYTFKKKVCSKCFKPEVTTSKFIFNDATTIRTSSIVNCYGGIGIHQNLKKIMAKHFGILKP